MVQFSGKGEEKMIKNRFESLEPLVNKTISPKDGLYSSYERNGRSTNYFLSGLRQLDKIDALLYKHTQKRLADCQSIADWACNYGRLLRCLRAALPKTTLYACDINKEAVDFCVAEFGCTPFLAGWHPDELSINAQHDLILCISLLTHTHRNFLPKVLITWEKMLRPGGLLLFTYLGERYLDEWMAGKMKQYGPPADKATMQQKAIEFQHDGYAFYGYKTSFSDSNEYGIGFMRLEIIQDEVKKCSTLVFMESLSGLENNGFAQDLAVIRKRL
jgi:SAM-dependent methyltransferase